MDNSEKIYTKVSDIEKEMKNLGSKHAKLQDKNHQDIISFNKPKAPIKVKWEEIKRKLQALPPGIYCIVFQDRFGKNVHQDKFYFGKGKYQVGVSEPGEQFQNQNQNHKEENLLSLDSAVKNIKEASLLSAENSVLKSENEKLKKENDLLCEKVKHLEEVNEELSRESELEEEPSPFAGLSSFFKELSPILPGIADRYFDLQNKKTEMQQAKLLMENGYELPGGMKKKQVNGNKPQQKQIPQPGSQEWNSYVEEVKQLPDEQFYQHLELMKNKFPGIYPTLHAEVMEEGEEKA